MTTQPVQPGLTYEDLLAFPEDNLRRELIDGDLIVTAAPSTRHQRAVVNLPAALLGHVKQHGGDVFPAPTDVYFTNVDVVEPDVVYVSPARLAQVQEQFVQGPPDVVIEVSSPSTRRLELVRKRELYERFEVPEYWYVDLDAERIEVYHLDEGRYPTPILLGRGETLTSPLIPGFEVQVDELLGDASG